MLVTEFVETTRFALSRDESIVTKIGQRCRGVEKVDEEKTDEDDHHAYGG